MNNADAESKEIGVGISFDLMDPVAVDFVAKKPIKIRDAYRLNYDQSDSVTIQNIIRDQILYGYTHGETVQAVAERIKKNLSGFRK
jgi:hypothetical protein